MLDQIIWEVLAWASAISGVSIFVGELKRWAEQRPISLIRRIINRLCVVISFTALDLMLFKQDMLRYYFNIW